MKEQAFELRHVVTFEETNLVGNVYYTNYFAWQGRCREMFLREHAPQSLAQIQSGSLRLVTAHASCDFVDEFTAFDEVCIRMRLLRFIPFGVSLGQYAQLSKPAELMARGRQDIKFMQRHHAEPERWDLAEIPAPLLEAFRRYE